MGSTTQLQPQQTSRTRLRAVPTVHDFQKGAVTRSSRRGRLRPALLEWPPLSRDASTSRDSHLNPAACPPESSDRAVDLRSEEHTSELQSRLHLVCRLLLEKKKNLTTALC